MREINLQSKFKRSAKREIPDAFYYKIPDTRGLGGRRPFDAFLVSHSIFFAIEFKSEENETTTFQDYNLQKVIMAGGYSLVIRPSNFRKQINFIKIAISGGKPNVRE